MAKQKKQRAPYVILDLGRLFKLAEQEPDRPHGDLVLQSAIMTRSDPNTGQRKMFYAYSAAQARAWASRVKDRRQILENPVMFPIFDPDSWYQVRFVHQLLLEQDQLIGIYKKTNGELYRRVLISAPQAA